MAALAAKMAQDVLVLTEGQLAALEKQKATKETYRAIATAHAGYLGCQDTYYVSNFKGIGKAYGQVLIDSYSRLTHGKVYQEKTALTGVDLLNDRILPWYQQEGVPLLRILTDRGSEYKGRLEHHAYDLLLS